jgi:hypothetical protein
VSRSIRLLVTTGIAENEEEMVEFKEEIEEQLAAEEVDLDDPYR